MDNFLFIAFPYLALVLAFGVGIYRHARRPYTYSSLSSEILEKRKLFWGSVPFHYGLVLILLAHLLAAFCRMQPDGFSETSFAAWFSKSQE